MYDFSAFYFLSAELKKPQPTSRAFTTATTQTFTSILPPSTLPPITETTTPEPPISNTTKTTISKQPNPIIQTSTTNDEPTSRLISTEAAPSTTNIQRETISPTQVTTKTHSTLSTDTSRQQTTTTPLVTSIPSTRTTLATTFREPINNTTKHTTTRNEHTTTSQVIAESVGMETNSGAGDGFQDFKTTTTAKKIFSPTSPPSTSNILGSTVTPGTTNMPTTTGLPKHAIVVFYELQSENETVGL